MAGIQESSKSRLVTVGGELASADAYQETRGSQMVALANGYIVTGAIDLFGGTQIASLAETESTSVDIEGFPTPPKARIKRSRRDDRRGDANRSSTA